VSGTLADRESFAPYTAVMRGLLAALLALLLVVVTTSDRLMCPDGCVDESPVQATVPNAAAPCALCQGWNPSVAVLTPRPAAVVIVHEASRAMRPLAPTRPALERPPKSA